MGLYDEGFESIGALIVTPQDTLNHMRTVDTEILSLGADIHSQASNVRPAFVEAWNTFEREWRAFYEENRGWFSRTLDAAIGADVYNKTTEYKESVAKWRQQAVEEGIVPTAPGPIKPWSETLMDIAKVGAILVGIGVVGYGISQVATLIREGRDTVKELKR